MSLMLLPGMQGVQGASSPSSSITQPVAAPEDAFKFQEDDFPEFDVRTNMVPPTVQQLNDITSLGATARWNMFGTPRSLITYNSYLAANLSGDPATAVREWIRANRSLFRLSDADVTNLALIHNVQMPNSHGRSLLFEQRYGQYAAVVDGMIAVGYVDGKIAYVASSTAPWDGAALGAATVSASEAWRIAAADLGRNVPVADITSAKGEDDWTIFNVAGFAQAQRVRLRVLPMPTHDGVGGARLVYDTLLMDIEGGESLAYSHLIDAQTGAVLLRHTRKEYASEGGGPGIVDTGLVSQPTQLGRQIATQTTPFIGAFTKTECGSPNNLVVPVGVTSLVVSAAASNALNDIVLKLLFNTIPTPNWG